MSTKARRIKLAETLAGQQIFWTPSFSGDQYGDLTKQRKIISGTQPRSPVLGLHSRTLLFITSFLQAVGCPENLPEWHICAMFRRLVAMFLSDTSEFGWCHSTPRSRWDSTRSSCCLLTAHLLTNLENLEYGSVLREQLQKTEHTLSIYTVRRRLCQRQEKDQ